MTASGALNSPAPQDDMLQLTVFTAPTTRALTQLLLLVRGRGANVVDLHWQIAPTKREGIAALRINLEKARQPHLEAAIARIVDVRSVVVNCRPGPARLAGRRPEGQ